MASEAWRPSARRSRCFPRDIWFAYLVQIWLGGRNLIKGCLSRRLDEEDVKALVTAARASLHLSPVCSHVFLLTNLD